MIATLAIVGRPNVGKSTLFNRLIGRRKALVHDTPGVTRDRNYGRAEWSGRDLLVIDTGGFEPDSDEGMLPQMRQQAQLAVEEADAILFVVDGRTGLTPTDEQVFAILRNASSPVFVVVNKIESRQQHPDVLEFHALGVETLFPISAEHGIDIDELMDALDEQMPEMPDEQPDEQRTRIAVVGRPNAGKSTLINQLLGSERLITSDIPGTTRDSIDSDFELNGRFYTLIDTVGMRRRRGISAAVEHFGVVKAMQSIERCHVVVLMLDAGEGMTDQDARIANLAEDRGRGLVIALNKWDTVAKDHRTADLMVKDIHTHRATLSYAPIVTISALTGQRAIRLMETVANVRENWHRRVPTSEINQWLEQTLKRKPPPLHKNRAVKVYYITQARTGPPTFVMQSNMPPEGFPTAYQRYLVGRLRDNWDFEGSPIRLTIRQRASKYRKS